MTTESNIDLQKLTLEPSDKNKTGSQENGEGQANITTGLSHMCAICATPAKLCCAACSSANLKEEGTNSTWYCGKDCQTKDWPAHKIHCKEIRAKVDFRSLKRAARILHALFEQYRRTGFDLSIADATRRGRLLYVKEGEYDFKQTFLPGYTHVEASSLELEPDDHAMLLSMMCCDDVMIQFHECCSLFLRDTKLARDMKEVSLYPLPGPRGWIIDRPWGFETSDNSYRHSILKVILKSGTKWALDLTAAQYGYKEILLPWKDYIKERVKSTALVSHYGARVDSWFYKYGPFPAKGSAMNVNCRDPAELAKAISWHSYELASLIRPSLEASLQHYKISANDLLQTTDDEFETKFDTIVGTAKKEVLSFRQFNIDIKSKSSSNATSNSGTTRNSINIKEDSNGMKHFCI